MVFDMHVQPLYLRTLKIVSFPDEELFSETAASYVVKILLYICWFYNLSLILDRALFAVASDCCSISNDL